VSDQFIEALIIVGPIVAVAGLWFLGNWYFDRRDRNGGS